MASNENGILFKASRSPFLSISRVMERIQGTGGGQNEEEEIEKLFYGNDSEGSGNDLKRSAKKRKVTGEEVKQENKVFVKSDEGPVFAFLLNKIDLLQNPGLQQNEYIVVVDSIFQREQVEQVVGLLPEGSIVTHIVLQHFSGYNLQVAVPQKPEDRIVSKLPEKVLSNVKAVYLYSVDFTDDKVGQSVSGFLQSCPNLQFVSMDLAGTKRTSTVPFRVLKECFRGKLRSWVELLRLHATPSQMDALKAWRLFVTGENRFPFNSMFLECVLSVTTNGEGDYDRWVELKTVLKLTPDGRVQKVNGVLHNVGRYEDVLEKLEMKKPGKVVGGEGGK